MLKIADDKPLAEAIVMPSREPLPPADPPAPQPDAYAVVWRWRACERYQLYSTLAAARMTARHVARSGAADADSVAVMEWWSGPQ